MELRVGDRLVDETAEWEVIGRPYTTACGQIAHVRVQRADNPNVMAIRVWVRARARQREASGCGRGRVMVRLRRASVIASLSVLAWAATAYNGSISTPRPSGSM